MVNKTLPITKALYPGYSFFYLFDNTNNHPIFAQNILHTIPINKRDNRQQP